MSKKILIASRFVEIRFLLLLNLEERDVELTEVSSAANARVIARTGKPDLIFLDYDMPGLNGEHGIAKIRGEGKGADIPIVLLVREVSKTMPQGIRNIEILPVPFSQEQLTGTIEKLIGELPLAPAPDSETIFLIRQSIKELLEKGISPRQTEKETREEGKRKKILIVDDEKQQRDLLNIMLRDHYDFIEAESGEEMIRKAHEHKPDLVISDVIMPGTSGFRAVGELKKDREYINLPVIFCSGRVTDRDLYNTLKPRGKSHFLLKPVHRKDLLDTIKELLEAAT